MYVIRQDNVEYWFVIYHRIAKGMSNLKKNGQQMNTGEIVWILTPVTKKSLSPTWKRN